MIRDANFHGGCKVVSDRLYQCFCMNGYQAVLFSLYDTKENAYVSIGINKKKRLNHSDIRKAAACICENKITHLIVQTDAPVSSVFYPKLLHHLHKYCRIYCVLHNSTASYFKTYRSYKVYTADAALKRINSRLVNIRISKSRTMQNASFARMVTLSRISQQDLKEYTGRGSAVIENCLPDAEPAVLEKKKNICMYIGRMDSYQKNVYLLLEAWRKAKTLPGWELYMLGKGREYAGVRNYIRKHHLQNVRLFGEVSVRQTAEYLKHSKVFLMTSNYEGLPTAAAEAMGYQNAIISTRYDGLDPDLLKDGYNCLLADYDAADYAEKIQTVLKDQKLWKRLACNGRRRYEEMQKLHIIEKWEREFAAC